MKVWQKTSLTIFFIALLCIAVGCEQKKVASKIVVATDATLPPMSFSGEKNELKGFEIDLFQAVAKKAGLELEWVNLEWTGLIPGVLTGKFDAAIGSITILDERKKKVGFSKPYLKSGLSLVVRQDSEIDSLKTMIDKSARVGAQRGTTAWFFLKDLKPIQKKAYDLYAHAVSDLINRELDVVLGESTGTLYYKSRDHAVFEKIKMVGEILTEESYGIVVSLDNQDLKHRIDRSLTVLTEEGTLRDLHEKWDLGAAATLP